MTAVHEQVLERAEAGMAEACRNHLSLFLPVVFRTDAGRAAFPPPHLERVLWAIEHDELGHTVVSAPPGSAKTNTMIAACAWWLGQDPAQHIGYISNTAAQAYRRSVAVRDTLEASDSYRAIFPQVRPDRSKGWAEAEWYLQRRDISDKDATFTAAGIGGPILGARFDRVVLDDIADTENMATDTQREKAIDWLSRTLMSRLTPKGRVFMIANRWHEKDPVAWARERGWHVIYLPAVEDGRSYWPERWPADFFVCPGEEHRDAPRCCEKARLGARLFNLMYQGQVVSDEGAYFKRTWWQSYQPNEIAYRFSQGQLRAGLFVDTAQTINEGSDWSIIASWLTDGVRGYLWNVRRGKCTFPELMSQCIAEQKAMNMAPIYIEEVPWSLPLIQSLRTTNPGVIGWRIGQSVQSQNKSKQGRAAAASPFAEAGNLYLPYQAPWRDDFVEEHAAFPAGSHDDMVDTTSMFCLEMMAKRQLTFGMR